jgi:hypothetical protein
MQPLSIGVKMEIIARCRNNADARRIGAGQVRVPGGKARHTGGHMIKIETYNSEVTKAWLDKAHEIESYEEIIEA